MLLFHIPPVRRSCRSSAPFGGLRTAGSRLEQNATRVSLPYNTRLVPADDARNSQTTFCLALYRAMARCEQRPSCRNAVKRKKSALYSGTPARRHRRAMERVR